jgi:glycerol-3-phosphate acyltransferase PlsY
VPTPLALADLLPALPQGAEWLSILLSYLLGAVPFGWLMARLLKGVDIREIGSGNIGATNAMRALGKPLGLVAFLLDFAKGAVPVLLVAPAFSEDPGNTGLAVLSAAAAVCGHVWPVYLGFKGGKAVATGFGALCALDLPTALIGGAVWVVVIVLTRFTGLASCAMGVAFPVAAWWRASRGEVAGEVAFGAALLTLLILVRHRSNMARMLKGTEPRIGARGKSGGKA